MNITQLDVGYNIIASTSHLLVQPRISWLQTVLIVSPIYLVIIRRNKSNKISENAYIKKIYVQGIFDFLLLCYNQKEKFKQNIKK